MARSFEDEERRRAPETPTASTEGTTYLPSYGAYPGREVPARGGSRQAQTPYGGSSSSYQQVPYVQQAGASYARQVHPVASPPQQAYRRGDGDQYRQRRSGGRYWQRAVGGFLHVIGILLRIFAIVLCLLVVANAFLTGSARLVFLEVTQTVSGLLPASLAGTFLYPTPFGGVLRGDFALFSVILFVIDWLFQKAASALR